MSNFFDQFFSLGLGVMVASKEQAEKVVNELVEKGEISKKESMEMMEKLIEKGDKTKRDLDETVKTRVQKTLKELNLVTMEDYRKLEERIAQLEKKSE